MIIIVNGLTVEGEHFLQQGRRGCAARPWSDVSTSSRRHSSTASPGFPRHHALPSKPSQQTTTNFGKENTSPRPCGLLSRGNVTSSWKLSQHFPDFPARPTRRPPLESRQGFLPPQHFPSTSCLGFWFVSLSTHLDRPGHRHLMHRKC